VLNGSTTTDPYETALNDSNLKPQTFDPKSTFVTFDFRYKKSLNSESIPLQKVLRVEDIVNKYGRSDNLYFAAGVAAYGMVLRNSPYKGDATIDMARKLVENHIGEDPLGYRKGLLELMDKCRKN
jgi:Ca-activated chloride channel family protein